MNNSRYPNNLFADLLFADKNNRQLRINPCTVDNKIMVSSIFVIIQIEDNEVPPEYFVKRLCFIVIMS